MTAWFPLIDFITLGDDNPHTGTETSAIFAGIGSDVRVKVKHKGQGRSEGQPKRPNRFDLLKEKEKELEKEEKKQCGNKEEDESKPRKKKVEEDGEESSSEDEKLSRMKMLAKKLSQQIGGLNKAPSVDDEHVNNGEVVVAGGTEKADKAEGGKDRRKSHKKSKKSKKHKRRPKDASEYI